MTDFSRTAGLVLWRLRGSDVDQLWCHVKYDGDALILTVHQMVTGDVAIVEPHRDIDTLLSRADQLQDTCVSAGWQELSDIEEWV